MIFGTRLGSGFCREVSLVCATLFVLATVTGFKFSIADASAQSAGDPSQLATYDVTALGVPKFVATNFTDPANVAKISKFRSGAGHSYADTFEVCRSMKHYFYFTSGLADIKLYAPVAGRIFNVFPETQGGMQVQIQSDVQPAFVFSVFHVNLAKPLAAGQTVAEGELLGSAYDPNQAGDIAVSVRVPGATFAYRNISYFDTLSDAAFAPFVARGLATRDSAIISQAQRDAQPLSCNGETFLQQSVASDFVDFASAVATGPVSILAPVYASSNPGLQSLLRIYNGRGSANGRSTDSTVALTLRDGASGTIVGRWTSPVVQPGASVDFPIATVETGLFPGVTKPATYTILVEAAHASMSIQHAVLNTVDGILTNMSTCSTGLSVVRNVALNVGASQFADGRTSTVAIVNSDTKYAFPKITLYDSERGFRSGGFSLAPIPAGGHLVMTVDAMETATRLSPLPARYAPKSYAVRFDSAFPGFMQHLVSNTAAGMTTDMTAFCPIGGPGPEFRSATGALRLGPVFAGGSVGESSFQVANMDVISGAVTLTVRDPVTGASFGKWTSPNIPVGTVRKFSIATIESGLTLPASKPAAYSVTVQSPFAGEIQHVLQGVYNDSPINLSTCDYGVTTTPGRLNGVNSSRAPGLSSAVVVTNTGNTQGAAVLAIYDGATGARLGTAITPPVPAGAHIDLSSATLESAAGISPSPVQLLYVVRLEGTFSGFLQHVVTNAGTGLVSDMSAGCKLQLVPKK